MVVGDRRVQIDIGESSLDRLKTNYLPGRPLGKTACLLRPSVEAASYEKHLPASLYFLFGGIGILPVIFYWYAVAASLCRSCRSATLSLIYTRLLRSKIVITKSAIGLALGARLQEIARSTGKMPIPLGTTAAPISQSVSHQRSHQEHHAARQRDTSRHINIFARLPSRRRGITPFRPDRPPANPRGNY